MQRRITAQQALLRLQDISADCSDGEHSDSELNDALTNDVEVELDSSEENSNVDSASENDDSDSQNQAQVNQVLPGKDGTVWQVLAIFHVQRRSLQQQNILSFKPGPTAFATIRIIESSHLFVFCLVRLRSET